LRVSPVGSPQPTLEPPCGRQTSSSLSSIRSGRITSAATAIPGTPVLRSISSPPRATCSRMSAARHRAPSPRSTAFSRPIIRSRFSSNPTADSESLTGYRPWPRSCATAAGQRQPSRPARS
jgi:hypothetical protein